MSLRIIALCIFISSTVSGQPTMQKSANPFLFIDSVFKKGNYIVEILDLEFPKDIQDIVLRFQKNTAENKKWFEDFFSKNYKPGEGLPYHENFGITKDEYQKVKNIANTPPIVVVKGTTSIQINRVLGALSFKATEKSVQFFESLKIDIKNKNLIFLNDTIPFFNEINAGRPTPFGQWHGFSWKKEVANFGENDDIKMDSLVSKIIEINIGKLETKNKILFRLKYKEVDKRVVKANFDISCYLN